MRSTVGSINRPGSQQRSGGSVRNFALKALPSLPVPFGRSIPPEGPVGVAYYLFAALLRSPLMCILDASSLLKQTRWLLSVSLSR